MERDAERVQRICSALLEARLDALICGLPTNVLMVSGYWPVTGLSLALITAGGNITLLVPEDEEELASHGWADDVVTISGGSLDRLDDNALERYRGPLVESITRRSLFSRSRIGCEDETGYQPASYAAMHLPGPAFGQLLREIIHQSEIIPVGNDLSKLRARLTTDEVRRVQVASRIAEQAFADGASQLRRGLREYEVANRFRAGLTSLPDGVERTDGFIYCMSGPNSFEAYAAFQRTRSRKLKQGDLVLVHCNSYADGFWTDITRTFSLGRPARRQTEMFRAVFAARQAALDAVRPGVTGSEVDTAARHTMKAYGFEKEFRHPTGHGLGFAAINHNAKPRIHPKSNDVLEPGMVFNIEPGIYIEGLGGMRHCDMVVLRENGPEVLTPFQCSIEELTMAEAEAGARRRTSPLE